MQLAVAGQVIEKNLFKIELDLVYGQFALMVLRIKCNVSLKECVFGVKLSDVGQAGKEVGVREVHLEPALKRKGRSDLKGLSMFIQEPQHALLMRSGRGRKTVFGLESVVLKIHVESIAVEEIRAYLVALDLLCKLQEPLDVVLLVLAGCNAAHGDGEDQKPPIFREAIDIVKFGHTNSVPKNPEKRYTA